MFNKAYFLRVQGCSHRLFSYHISEVYAFYPINEREKQDAGVVVPAKRGNCIWKRRSEARREYKDTVFRMLFSDEKNLLSLYNAVTGRSYEDAKELEIVTLDNAVYMGMRTIWHFYCICTSLCTNISRRRTRTCRCGICFIFLWNIRSM